MSQTQDGTNGVAAPDRIEQPRAALGSPSASPRLGGSSDANPDVQPPLRGVFELYAELMAPPAGRGQLGKIVIRVPKPLHDALRERAALEGVSLNWLCTALIAGWPIHPVPKTYKESTQSPWQHRQTRV